MSIVTFAEPRISSKYRAAMLDFLLMFVKKVMCSSIIYLFFSQMLVLPPYQRSGHGSKFQMIFFPQYFLVDRKNLDTLNKYGHVIFKSFG